MKLVASSKLRKAQAAIGNLLPYESQMHHILADLIAGEENPDGLYVRQRPVKKVAIVAFSSNTSLCGSFNSVIARHFNDIIAGYVEQGLSKDDMIVFPVGRKIADASRRAGFNPYGDYAHLADRPSYKEASELAMVLMGLFSSGQVDRVELLYNHCKSASSQIPVREAYLPLPVNEEKTAVRNFIVEPDPASVLEALIPKVLLLKIYAVLLDASAAEHAARTVSMQAATDNGRQLLQDITVQYNKRRQQAITDELQDIVGGTMTD